MLIQRAASRRAVNYYGDSKTLKSRTAAGCPDTAWGSKQFLPIGRRFKERLPHTFTEIGANDNMQSPGGAYVKLMGNGVM